jgi:hypothetical protein
VSIPSQADKIMVDLRSDSTESFSPLGKVISVPFTHPGRIMRALIIADHGHSNSYPSDIPRTFLDRSRWLCGQTPWGLIAILDVDLHLLQVNCNSADIMGHGGTTLDSSAFSFSNENCNLEESKFVNTLFAGQALFLYTEPLQGVIVEIPLMSIPPFPRCQWHATRFAFCLSYFSSRWPTFVPRYSSPVYT